MTHTMRNLYPGTLLKKDPYVFAQPTRYASGDVSTARKKATLL